MHQDICSPVMGLRYLSLVFKTLPQVDTRKMCPWGPRVASLRTWLLGRGKWGHSWSLHSGWCVCACMPGCFSCVQLFATLWIVAHQAPLSMGFPRQEYWSGVPCPPPGDLPDPWIEHASPALQADSLPLSHWGAGVGLNDQQALVLQIWWSWPCLLPHIGLTFPWKGQVQVLKMILATLYHTQALHQTLDMSSYFISRAATLWGRSYCPISQRRKLSLGKNQ